MDRLDKLQLAIAAAREKRETELREAFRHPDALNALIGRDCAELIAGIGGYAAPLDRKQRQKWIQDNMHHDALFVAQVKATENLIREYVEFAMRSTR